MTTKLQQGRELWVCEKKSHLPEHDGGTGYYYYEPLYPLTPYEFGTDSQPIIQKCSDPKEPDNILSDTIRPDNYIIKDTHEVAQSQKPDTTLTQAVDNSCGLGAKIDAKPRKWKREELYEISYKSIGCFDCKEDKRVAVDALISAGVIEVDE